MIATTEDIVAHLRVWSIERSSHQGLSEQNAKAIISEFYEWIEPEGEDIEILSLEPMS